MQELSPRANKPRRFGFRGAVATTASASAAEQQDTGAATGVLADLAAATMAEQADNAAGVISMAGSASVLATGVANEIGQRGRNGAIVGGASVASLQMWTVYASVQPNEDFDTVLTPISFEADGVTPQSLGVHLHAEAQRPAGFRRRAERRVVVNGNRLPSVPPVSSPFVGPLSLHAAGDGWNSCDLLTVGAPASFKVTAFGSIVTAIKVISQSPAPSP